MAVDQPEARDFAGRGRVVQGNPLVEAHAGGNGLAGKVDVKRRPIIGTEVLEVIDSGATIGVEEFTQLPAARSLLDRPAFVGQDDCVSVALRGKWNPRRRSELKAACEG